MRERWSLRGYQIRAGDGLGQHVATYQCSIEDGKLLAAAPMLIDTLEELLEYAERLAVAMRSVDWASVPKDALDIAYRENLCGKKHEASKLMCLLRNRVEACREVLEK